ncbi:hypothetical protein [Campylobacter devanensis]|uniref:hypothetical protein n=1 Tax=Campylobacter devanensis TaxID=3161138 RepID=UPI000A32FA32|nr:hypothetical protein [Campylobacter sp. P0023]
MSRIELEKYNDMSLKKLVSFLEKESIKLKELESNLQTKIQEKSELIAHRVGFGVKRRLKLFAVAFFVV